jgi:phage shock protein A
MPDSADIAWQNALDTAVARYSELKEITASIVVRRDEARVRLETAQRALGALQTRLDAALEADRDDEALTLMEQQEAEQRAVAGMMGELETAERDADDAKAQLVTLRKEIENAKVEKVRRFAQGGGRSIDERIDDLEPDAVINTLDNVREHIRTTLARVDLDKELGGGSPSAPKAPSSEEQLRAQLEALKQARLNPGAATPTKKM